MRKTRVREMLSFLHAPDQVGFTPTMGIDASPGISRMAYQSAYGALNQCEVGRIAPVRLAGTSSRAHSSARTDLAQRAKVGHCPYCTRATHVARPQTYAPGFFHLLHMWPVRRPHINPCDAYTRPPTRPVGKHCGKSLGPATVGVWQAVIMRRSVVLAPGSGIGRRPRYL